MFTVYQRSWEAGFPRKLLMNDYLLFSRDPFNPGLYVLRTINDLNPITGLLREKGKARAINQCDLAYIKDDLLRRLPGILNLAPQLRERTAIHFS